MGFESPKDGHDARGRVGGVGNAPRQNGTADVGLLRAPFAFNLSLPLRIPHRQLAPFLASCSFSAVWYSSISISTAFLLVTKRQR